MDAAKDMLREKFRAVNAYITADDRSQITNLNYYINKSGKEEENRCRGNKRKNTKYKSMNQ